jgi:hypothetical protein
MIRIQLYHWLPIADNMLPDILDALEKEKSGAGIKMRLNLEPGNTTQPEAKSRKCQVTYVHSEKNAISFDLQLPHPKSQTVKGNINNRGFAQYKLDIVNDAGQFTDIVQEYLDLLREAMAELLLAILSDAVRNKLAVFEEGIRSIDRFRNPPFDSDIDVPARQFLQRDGVVVVIVDQQHYQLIKDGATLFGTPRGLKIVGDSWDVRIPSGPLIGQCFTNNVKTIFIIPVGALSGEEDAGFKTPQYQLCALFCIQRFTSNTVDILKLVRSHAIPVRRQMSIALQKDIIESFESLTSSKKYLTYVNIKLPVVSRVINHLRAASRSSEFGDKLKKFFSNVEQDKVTKNWTHGELVGIDPTLSVTSALATEIKPSDVINEWEESIIRAETLFEEDKAEIEKLSDETTKFLEGATLSEALSVDERRLDTAKASLEIDRVGKNRSNALKILSAALSFTAAVQLSSVFKFPFWGTIALVLGIPVLVFIGIEYYIRYKGSFMRVILPFDCGIRDIDAFSKWIDSHDLKRRDSNGARRIVTWNQHLRVSISNKHAIRTRKNNESPRFRQWPFAVTCDYLKTGFLYSITLETEYNSQKFLSWGLVHGAFEMLNENGCLDLLQPESSDTSLMACVYSNLKLQLGDLPALVRLLATSERDIQRLLDASMSVKNEKNALLSTTDAEFASQFTNRDDTQKYIDWLNKNKDEDKFGKLIGKTLMERRAEFLSLHMKRFS